MMNLLDSINIINQHKIFNPWCVWDILSGCRGLIGSLPWHDTPGKETDLCVHLCLGHDHLLCFPASVSFLALPPVPCVLRNHKDDHSADKHTRLRPTLDPLASPAASFLQYWGVIVSSISGDTWVKSAIMCLCCSTKSGFPLLTDRAAGWRSRHETGRQSGPVSHSSDTSDHTDLQWVRPPRCYTHEKNTICCKVVQPEDSGNTTPLNIHVLCLNFVTAATWW